MEFTSDPKAWIVGYLVATAFVGTGLFFLEYGGAFGRDWWTDSRAARVVAITLSVPAIVVGLGLAAVISYGIVGLEAGFVEPLAAP